MSPALPRDVRVYARYDEPVIAKLALSRERRRQLSEAEGILRLRWLPVARWPEHPFALLVFPWWRRDEADAVDMYGVVHTTEEVDHDVPDQAGPRSDAGVRHPAPHEVPAGHPR